MGEASEEVTCGSSSASPCKHGCLTQPHSMEGRSADNVGKLVAHQPGKGRNGNHCKENPSYQNGRTFLNGNIENEIKVNYCNEVFDEENNKSSSQSYGRNSQFSGSIDKPPLGGTNEKSLLDARRNQARGAFSALVDEVDNKSSDPASPSPRPSLPSESVDERESLQMEQVHVHDVYDQMAHHFADVRYKAWPGVKRFLQDLEPGALVADVGCGSGKYLSVNQDIISFGSDRCHGLVDLARGQGHEVMVCDNMQLPYRDCCFDAVISIGVLHHLTTRRRRTRALWELARILRPGGRLMLYVWAMEQNKRKPSNAIWHHRTWQAVVQFESQDVLVPWHFSPKQPARKGIRKERLVSTTSSVSEDEVFEDQASPKNFMSREQLSTKKSDPSCQRSVVNTEMTRHHMGRGRLDPIPCDDVSSPCGWCQSEQTLVGCSNSKDASRPAHFVMPPLSPRSSDDALRSPVTPRSRNSSPFTLLLKEGADVGMSPVQATGVSVLSCPQCGHTQEGDSARRKSLPTLGVVTPKLGHQQSVPEVIKAKLVSFFSRIAPSSANHTSRKVSRGCTHHRSPSWSPSSQKDVRYKELLDYIMKEEAELLAANQNLEQSPLASVMLEGFAVREFPQSSRTAKSDNVPLLSKEVLSNSNDKNVSDSTSVQNRTKLELSRICSVLSDDDLCDQVFEDETESLASGVQGAAYNIQENIAAPLVHFGMRHTTSVGENLCNIAEQCVTLQQARLPPLNHYSQDRDPDDLERPAARTPGSRVVPSVSISTAGDDISEHNAAKLAPAAASLPSRCVQSIQSPDISCTDQKADTLEVFDNSTEPSESTSRSSSHGEEPIADDDSDCGDWVRTTTAAIKAIQEQVLRSSGHHRQGSISPRHQSSCDSLGLPIMRPRLESTSSDGYSTASDYDDADSSDWSEQQDSANILGHGLDNQDSDFSSMNGAQEEVYANELAHSKDSKDSPNLPDVTNTRGSSLECHNSTPDVVNCEEKISSNDILKADNSDKNRDQLTLPAGEPTYHRYYHVFREGELDQLITKYVTSLEIVESYYDHANWCVIAKKLPKQSQ